MAKEVLTRHFGVVSYADEQVIHFPDGLPAFENQSEFLLIEQQETAPVVFLQSLSWTELSFITLPASLVVPNFQLTLSADDLELLELAGDSQPALGVDVFGLVIVTVPEITT